MPVEVHAERPFDPDDLPLEAQQTETEREIATRLAAHPDNGAVSSESGGGREGFPMLRGRPFRIRALAERVLGGGRHED